jgi:hypothetical protein
MVVFGRFVCFVASEYFVIYLRGLVLNNRRTVLECCGMWILQTDGKGRPHRFRLRSGAIKTVGRAPRADFILDAALVSRLHCRLTAEEDKVEVVDLSSTNGTFVNDKRVERAHLKNGDRLRIGRVELVVKRHGMADG